MQDRWSLVTFWLVVAVLACGLGVLLSAERYRATMLVAPAGAAGLWILRWHLRSHFPLLALFLVSAAAFPVELGERAGSTLSVTFFLAGLICLTGLIEWLLVPHKREFFSWRVMLATGCFVLLQLVSLLLGQLQWFPVDVPIAPQLAGFALFALSGWMLLTIGYQVESVAQVQRLTWCFLGAGAVTCLFQLSPIFDGITSWTTQPRSIGSGFWTWLVALAASQGLVNKDLSMKVRTAALLLVACALGHSMLQRLSWASGWVPALVVVSVILLLEFPRVFACLCGVGIAAALVAWQQLGDTMMANEGYSLTTRTEAWLVLWNVIRENPLFGLGPSAYYHYTSLFSNFGWYVKFSSHNNYVDMVAQGGLLGLAAFLWLVAELLRLTAAVRRSATSWFVRAFCTGALAGLAGAIVSGMMGDWLVPFVYNTGIPGFRSSILFWVFSGIVVALRRLTAAEPVRKARTFEVPRLAVSVASVGVE